MGTEERLRDGGNHAFIVGVDTETQTFRRCRFPDPRGQLFTIDLCFVGQTMSIVAAHVGYSEPASLTAECRWANCTTSIRDLVSRLCDGRRRCDVSQDLLIRPHGGALCALSRDANFIDVQFRCVAGTIQLLTCRVLIYKTQ